LIGEIVKVRLNGSRCCIVDFAIWTIVYKSIFVDFLDPFIDDGAAPGINHMWTEDSGLIRERSWRRLIASCLGKEDWDRVV
jgi:hypothetical protein